MKKIRMVALATIALVVALEIRARPRASDQATAATAGPQYTPDNRLIRPQGYREWIFVSSGLGMSYSLGADGSGQSPMFTNVFVEPSAYRHYMTTGRWPDKTIFVLEEYSSASHGSINKQGHYQDAFMGIEAEIKDESRFPETWAYFGFGAGGKTASAFANSECWSCHNQNGAVENTFAQFYPTLLQVAKSKGTVKANWGPSR